MRATVTLFALVATRASALEPTVLRRRSLLSLGAGALLAPAVGGAAPAFAAADEAVSVYFGCGCFWHVQHEFVEAERRLLGRGPKDYTSRAAYAGGVGGAGKGGSVCYHNVARKNDYGALGHAEVVALDVPPSKFGAVAEEYFKLFGPDGSRPDQFGDRGSEYRNVVGVPGGKSSPLVKDLLEAALKQGDPVDFATGKGSDADVKAVAWIMDSDKFPAFRAENYHQFHDGFARGENYPDAYNDLGRALDNDTACPPF